MRILIPIISKRTRKQWFNVNAFHDKESEGGKSGINPPDLHTYIQKKNKYLQGNKCWMGKGRRV